MSAATIDVPFERKNIVHARSFPLRARIHQAVIGRSTHVVRDRTRPIGTRARGTSIAKTRSFRSGTERHENEKLLVTRAFRNGEGRPRARRAISRAIHPPFLRRYRPRREKTPSSRTTRYGNGVPRPPHAANTPPRRRTRCHVRVLECSPHSPVFVALGPPVVGAFRARPDA